MDEVRDDTIILKQQSLLLYFHTLQLIESKHKLTRKASYANCRGAGVCHEGAAPTQR